MGMIKRALYGWKKSSAEIYAHCFNEFGGSVNMHPHVVDYFSSRFGSRLSFFHYEKKGEIIAAFALFDDKTPGVCQWREYPLSYDEILIPAKAGHRLLFPEKTNRLSCFNRGNFINASFTFARKNRVCFVKPGFSAKTEKNRRNAFNKFLRSGGRCDDLRLYSAEQLADYYIFLFKSRFADSVKCYSRASLIEIISVLRPMIDGHILFVDNEPCALDLIFMAESAHSIYYDVPNGGVNTRFSHLSPGSLLMWKNISTAREYCQQQGKEMRFSIGSLDDEWHYKLRWANACATGKTLF